MKIKNHFKKFLTSLKKQDWTAHFIEVIIVVLGVLIAFQFTKIGERKTELAQYKDLVASVKLENEKNMEEFEELRVYRHETLRKTSALLNHLNVADSILRDSIKHYLFELGRVSTPDLQLEALASLLNATFTNSNLTLKNEAIRLKALYDEWLLTSEGFAVEKEEKFFNYLFDSVDFVKWEIVNYEKIISLRFKNNIWDIRGSEREQTRLYKDVLKQFEKFHTLILKELDN